MCEWIWWVQVFSVLESSLFQRTIDYEEDETFTLQQYHFNSIIKFSERLVTLLKLINFLVRLPSLKKM